jgi:hypothetical protein
MLRDVADAPKRRCWLFWCRDGKRGSFGVIANRLADLPSYPGFVVEDGVVPFESRQAASDALEAKIARSRGFLDNVTRRTTESRN